MVIIIIIATIMIKIIRIIIEWVFLEQRENFVELSGVLSDSANEEQTAKASRSSDKIRLIIYKYKNAFSQWHETCNLKEFKISVKNCRLIESISFDNTEMLNKYLQNRNDHFRVRFTFWEEAPSIVFLFFDSLGLSIFASASISF